MSKLPKCYIAIRCPHGELEDIGAVFTNIIQAEKEKEDTLHEVVL
jgi:hypothetical protein